VRSDGVNAFTLHAQWTKPGMVPPVAVVGSEIRMGFVPPEGGFFMGKRIQESLGAIGKAFSLKERAI